MDPNSAIQFGQLVAAAYAVAPGDLGQAAGGTIPASFDPYGKNYSIITTIYSNDLATDMNPDRNKDIVSFGYVVQDKNGNVVIVIRGTAGIWEWVHDVEFLYVPCPVTSGAGSTDDGFTAIYKALSIDPLLKSPLVASLATLKFNLPVSSMTICGHSLGGALATITAFDVAANTPFKNPNAYTYASPRTGDPFFASAYNKAVPNTFRIANRSDLVPKLPLPPIYEHVAGFVDLNPVSTGNPPSTLVNDTIPCEHILTTYLYLLGTLAGVTSVQVQLDLSCQPKPLTTALV